jgi:hypothetical protein
MQNMPLCMQNAPAICAKCSRIRGLLANYGGGIGSSFGLVLTNALVATELSMFVDWPETGFEEVGRISNDKSTCRKCSSNEFPIVVGSQAIRK